MQNLYATSVHRIFEISFREPKWDDFTNAKGQKKSKKRTNEFYFTTMKLQVDLFSFVFGGN